jgi:hypothetical protein
MGRRYGLGGPWVLRGVDLGLPAHTPPLICAAPAACAVAAVVCRLTSLRG